MSASGNRNILRSGVNLEAREQPRMPDLAPDGSMVSRSNLTQEQSNARNESAFSRLRHNPHIIRIGAGSLFVELKIEGGNGNGSGSGSGAGGPAGANNNSSFQAAGEGGILPCSSCGKKKKPVQPQSAGDNDIDLNILPAETRDQQENHHFCECENHHPMVPGTGNPAATAAATAGSVDTAVLPRNAAGAVIQRGLAIGSAGMQSSHPSSLLPANNNNNSSGMLTLGQASNTPVNALHFPDPHHPQPSYRLLANTNLNHQMGEQAAVVAAAVGPPPPAYFQNHNLVIRPIMQQQQPRPAVEGGNQMRDGMAINLRPANPNLQGDDLPIGLVQAPVAAISDDENEELDPIPLDIEEMAYEEILALEEQIGNVNTGLAEEVIMEHLVRRYYRVPRLRPPEHTAELCSICLVEFENRDVLGKIICTHKYHFDCIKQWLMLKNFCPVCKRTAVLLP